MNRWLIPAAVVAVLTASAVAFAQTQYSGALVAGDTIFKVRKADGSKEVTNQVIPMGRAIVFGRDANGNAVAIPWAMFGNTVSIASGAPTEATPPTEGALRIDERYLYLGHNNVWRKALLTNL